jgi:hypothetical protein
MADMEIIYLQWPLPRSNHGSRPTVREDGSVVMDGRRKQQFEITYPLGPGLHVLNYFQGIQHQGMHTQRSGRRLGMMNPSKRTRSNEHGGSKVPIPIFIEQHPS